MVLTHIFVGNQPLPYELTEKYTRYVEHPVIGRPGVLMQMCDQLPNCE